MARGVNKVFLIGNLGQDPDVRSTPNGSCVANVTLATTTMWRDKQGELNESTEWHRIVFFNRLAEIVRDYLHKGSRVYVEGSLRTRKWTDKNNIDRYTTEIIVNEMQMLDARGGEAGRGGGTENYSKASENTAPAYKQSEYGSKETHAPTGHDNPPDFDDDIPF